MLNEIKQKIESKRNSKNIFWKPVVLSKDILFFLLNLKYFTGDHIFLRALSIVTNIRLRIVSFKDYPQDDVTVIIGVKNRGDYRIRNALRSIRNQTYDQKLISIILVDYGSEIKLTPYYKSICKEYDTRYIRVDPKGAWSRSRALNIGIKKSGTKYVLTSDVDIVFEKNYIEEAVKALKKDIFQILFCSFFVLDKNDITENTDVVADYDKIKMNARHALGNTGISYVCGQSINMGFRKFYCDIHGYDEFYEGWGNEDIDLVKRFKWSGLKIIDLKDKTSSMHQWHPQYEGIKKQDIDDLAKKNSGYYLKKGSIVRNKSGWGEI